MHTTQTVFSRIEKLTDALEDRESAIRHELATIREDLGCGDEIEPSHRRELESRARTLKATLGW
jgi:hypothetical protein